MQPRPHWGVRPRPRAFTLVHAGAPGPTRGRAVPTALRPFPVLSLGSVLCLPSCGFALT